MLFDANILINILNYSCTFRIINIDYIIIILKVMYNSNPTEIQLDVHKIECFILALIQKYLYVNKWSCIADARLFPQHQNNAVLKWWCITKTQSHVTPPHCSLCALMNSTHPFSHFWSLSLQNSISKNTDKLGRSTLIYFYCVLILLWSFILNNSAVDGTIFIFILYSTSKVLSTLVWFFSIYDFPHILLYSMQNYCHNF